ncbi:MAG: substrate-binding domain-containing protein [Thermodesulfobacteriota bacterium]
MRHKVLLTEIFFLLLFISGVFSVQSHSKTIILATTTSMQDSGLLDILIPIFQKKTGYFVKTIAVGSGQAISLGQRGEADVLLLHSPEDEKKFVKEGFGVHRSLVMHNDFVIVGPLNDPAKIKGIKSSSEAFKKIALSKNLFLSRGDHSGTHKKEQSIWRSARIKPEGEKWYQQTGLGMGQTLGVAAEKKGYTLTDRGTYLALKKNLGLNILVEGDPILLNLYHVIEVNPVKWPKVNSLGARAFSEFIVSKETQEIIRTFGVDQFGFPLFFPDAGKKEEELAK